MKIKKGKVAEMLGVIGQAMNIPGMPDSTIRAIIFNKSILTEAQTKITEETRLKMTDELVAYNKAVGEEYEKLRKKHTKQFEDHRRQYKNDGIPFELVTIWQKLKEKVDLLFPEEAKAIEKHREWLDKEFDVEIELDFSMLHDFTGLTPIDVEHLSFMVYDYMKDWK
jgi:hypothetical protein